MNIDGFPRLGTPKQNSFIIKLGGALGFATLQEAANAGLKRPPTQPLPDPFSMADASTVITELLAKCAAAGISTFSARGKGKKKKKSKGSPPPSPATDPQPALVATDPASGLVETFHAMPMQQGTLALERLLLAYCNRGGDPGSLLSTQALAAELVKRNGTTASMFPTDELCGELERRGLPGIYLLEHPDAVTVAARALEWMDWNLNEISLPNQRESGAAILRDAGMEVTD